MKFFKRITSLFLVMVIIVMTLSLNGCVSRNTESITMGEWIKSIDDSFGMESYSDTTPHVKSVSADNMYFDYVQTAYEWDVFDKEKEFNVDDDVIWRDALVMLVNAGSFFEEDATEDEKINFAIENFDNTIKRYALNWEIPARDAAALLETAQEQWTNKKFLRNYEEVKYADNVKDFTATGSNLQHYSFKNNRIVMPVSEAQNLKEGDVFIMPSNGDTKSNGDSVGIKAATACKAKSIKKSGNSVIIETSNDDLTIEDTIKSLQSEGTYEANADNIEILDGNGQVVFRGDEASDNQNVSLTDDSNIQYIGLARTDTAKTIKTKSKHYKVGDNDINLEYSVGKTMSLKASVKNENKSLPYSVSTEISDLEVSQKVDIEMFKLKYALLSVDYKTKTTFSAEKSYEKKGIVAPYNNGNGKFLTNLKKSKLKSSEAKGAKTIKIGSINLWSCGVARICLDVNLNIKIDGSVEITITEQNQKGVEYKDGIVRFMKSKNKDIDVSIKAKIEGTISIGPALYVTGLKKKIIGLDVTVGLGIETSVTVHLVDAENHELERMSGSDISPETTEMLKDADITASQEAIKQAAENKGYEYATTNNNAVKLHVDACFDVSAYFILKLELSETSMAAELLKGKLHLSCEVFGSKNGKFLNAHVDNWDWSMLKNIKFGKAANKSQCTLNYNEFENLVPNEEEKTTENENFSIDSYTMELAVGESQKLNIKNLPSPYSYKDLVFSSNNNDIVSVSSDGTVTAKAEGIASIQVKTNDGKYNYSCVIFVS